VEGVPALRRRRAVSAAATRIGLSLPAALRTAAGLTALVVLSAVLRTRAIDGPLWIDEGLSVGIASRPLEDIPGALAQDGSPPLYYALLSAWMTVAGDSDAAVRALSLAIALLAVPAAWLAARALAGERAAWIAAVLVAANPFLTYHAQEARMYALALLLALLAAALVPLAAVEGRGRAYAGLGAVLVLLVYTHNWGLYVVAAAGAAGLVAARAAADPGRERRRLLLCLAAVAVAYLPWLPTLVEQARHTGAPWSAVPGPGALADVLDLTLGGAALAAAVLVPAGLGMVRALRSGLRDRAAVLVVAAICAAVPVLGWCGAQIAPNWAGRYLAVAVGPLILLVALGLARAGTIGLVACALLAGAWLLDDPPGVKSNVAAVAAAAAPALAPGDVVLVTHPEQVALLHRELPGGLGWWTSLGPSSDPRMLDWRDAVERLRAADPGELAPALLGAVPRGGRLLLAEPLIRGDGGWRAPWTRLVRRRAEEWRSLLEAAPSLAEVGSWPAPGSPAPGTSMRLTVFAKDLGVP
jgi:hypothetical protein